MGLPIRIIAAWWAICFVFYVTGWPIAYRRENVVQVSSFFLSSAILIVIAYILVARRAPVAPQVVSAQRMPKPMLIGFVATVVLYVPLVETYSGFHFWEILSALTDQNEAYYRATAIMANGLGSRLLIVGAQTVVAPLTMAVLPFLALGWFERRKHGRRFILVFVISISMSILVGRDFQLFLAGLMVACAWTISRIRRRIGFSVVHPAVIAGLGALFLILSGLRKYERMTGSAFCPPGADACATSGPPTLWDSIIITFASYASQGFEGLGRALNATWTFGGGYSHSPAVAEIFKKVFDTGSSNVITAQLGDLGWSATGLWSTGFTMLANDVPWVLIPFVVALQSALMAASWKRALRTGDWLATAVFSYTFVILVFMPMTLQLATSGPLYLGYVGLTVAFVMRAVGEKYGRSRSISPLHDQLETDKRGCRDERTTVG